MRILVISDSHGHNEKVEEAVRRAGPVDMLIHCGDVSQGESYIRSLVACPVHMVAGNNDFFLDLPRYKIIQVEGHRILLIHGHRHRVHSGVGELRKLARKHKADIVMFGHTHRPYLSEEEGLTLLNPGSIAYPRNQGRIPTYLLMEIFDEGTVQYTHFEL